MAKLSRREVQKLEAELLSDRARINHVYLTANPWSSYYTTLLF